MSAFHRVDDIYSMPGPRFFALACRLDCYRGVMRERALAWQREHDGDPQPAWPAASPSRAPAAARPAGNQGTPVISRADASDPVLGKFISFGPAER